ncbi:MAG: MurR/RpiR family transcriptional regulator [Bacillota bacterium]|uniref:MurR/RpiR family transcriptional regulator n=1 Tax=Virgibacillus salarius TaxID=447199 RepID=A0A941I9K4_9BACI|nr:MULTISPECIES: MurR/RpiR family transcriptional regulator [Bacillaceae]NAZ09574.1 SIS domain-containing protein [Agaribacter marinus]MBR7796864.1 MurR/RpiR family transcriptional regulator [Virgibacillus salarius]MCC2249987.1 MurR/RpiR family transcriptional regulator [Virgibacillus sp. AGTR]MDY7044675.1 MurR/RpiR family transcriptional regulator [Virgibacillus sp. M23]QRZ18158.1 MurR/RpiR family transcriptional regulator [Virgibacillus sp. AGTR]
MRSILDEIQLKYQTLSKTEKKIADYIIHHSETLLNIHIQELADRINVSIATITRFCKKIGATSFVEFKILLRDAVEETLETHNAVEKVDQIYHSVIKSTNSLTSIQKYETACDWIVSSKAIHIYGLGSSGLSAQELKLRLARMGFTVDTHTDSHDMIINASILTSEDLVIAISSSGKTQEVIDGVKLAQKNNAKIIAVTNFSKTKLANSSDLILYTSNLKTYQEIGFMNSQLSILLSLDILSMLLLLHKEDAQEKHDLTLHALNEYKKI